MGTVEGFMKFNMGFSRSGVGELGSVGKKIQFGGRQPLPAKRN